MSLSPVKICLLTPGQPSTNPRLVKEADALTEAGYQVHVICAYWAQWATEFDKELLSSRFWTCSYVGGHPKTFPFRYYWTRIRHCLSRKGLKAWKAKRRLLRWAFCRVLPELERAAEDTKARLYIAHYPETLPAAMSAAERNYAKVGFDAEDFHTDSPKLGSSDTMQDHLTEYFESHFLKRCDYLTTSSPLIADSYVAKYGIPKAATILNVFPLSQRPHEFRQTKMTGPLTLYWFSQTIGADRGLEDIVKAIGSLRECRIELHLRGNWQAGYRQRLFRLAGSFGLKAEQIIVHELEPPDEMVRHASGFDVGLALEPGRDENNQIAISNKIFTYLLAGNALVATATKGQEYIMKTLKGAGFCYRPGDVYALTEQLKVWYDDRVSLQEARRQAWDSGTWRYNWDLEKKKFLEVIDSVLKTAH